MGSPSVEMRCSFLTPAATHPRSPPQAALLPQPQHHGGRPLPAGRRWCTSLRRGCWPPASFLALSQARSHPRQKPQRGHHPQRLCSYLQRAASCWRRHSGRSRAPGWGTLVHHCRHSSPAMSAPTCPASGVCVSWLQGPRPNMLPWPRRPSGRRSSLRETSQRRPAALARASGRFGVQCRRTVERRGDAGRACPRQIACTSHPRRSHSFRMQACP
mmetsp:Transcript_88043/g.257360  ORF Transcript_88043/g.257360 Transcript_88043/m.257360 type:complete len:215 (+) Transcript_88043:717-1361(+)